MFPKQEYGSQAETLSLKGNATVPVKDRKHQAPWGLLRDVPLAYTLDPCLEGGGQCGSPGKAGIKRCSHSPPPSLVQASATRALN